MLIVHINLKDRSGRMFRNPNLQVFAKSWFQWLESEAPEELAIYEDDERDDGQLCTIQRIDHTWYVVYKGRSKKYREVIGSSAEVTFDNLQDALRLVRLTVQKAEGTLRRQD